MKLRKDMWNTYETSGYTHQHGTDPRATGGVHCHQIKRYSYGWYCRVIDVNFCFESAGPSEHISNEEGEKLFVLAKKCEDN
jgi:hypothetical protein